MPVKAEVLRPFIGQYSEEDRKNNTGEFRYANAQEVIVHGLHHPATRHLVRPNVIELTETRFKELSDLKIVRAYDEKTVRATIAKGAEFMARLKSKVPNESQVVSKGGIKESK